MKMHLFDPFRIKFEQVDWSRNPEFGLLDTILESHPELLTIVSGDILKGSKSSVFGRQDMPSVEQIVRSAIYEEINGLYYSELGYHQSDSRICEQFINISLSFLYSEVQMKNHENKKSLLTDLIFFNWKSSHKSPIKNRRFAGN